ncbi:MAG: hypothetical protein ACI97A_001901 [Planctomycetota bacterium]|jgi:hypothetical protein
MFRIPCNRVFGCFLVLTLSLLINCGGADSSPNSTKEGPKDLKGAMADFRAAWNSNNSIDLEATFAAASVGEIATDIDTFCGRYGWDGTDLPKIETGIARGGVTIRVASFAMGEDAIEVSMEERDEAWVVVKIKPQVKLNLKSMDEVVNNFMEAWNTSDYDAVYAFLTPAMFDKKKSFVRLFKKREWDIMLPRIERPSTTEVDEFQQATTFQMSEGGKLKCKWIIEAGRWGLRTLRPPRN